MKNILLLGLLILGLSTNASAFFTSNTSAPTTGKLIKPTHEYEVDTWGTNSEVYEFTPRSNSNMTCVVWILDNMSSTSMQCFPKEGK